MLSKTASDLLKKVEQAKNSKKIVVFLAGTCSDGNEWRREVLKESDTGKFFFLDPFDEKWDPQDNIYDELIGLNISDLVVFYKPGKLSEKEKKFLELSKGSKSYKEFDTVKEILSFLGKFKDKKSVSEQLRKVAIDLSRVAMPHVTKGDHEPVDFKVEMLDNDSIQMVSKDFEGGKTIRIPRSDNIADGMVEVNIQELDDHDKEWTRRILRQSARKNFSLNPTYYYDPVSMEYKPV